MRYQPLKWLILFILVSLGLTSCTTSSSSIPASESQVIDYGSSFGQTFTAQNKGLESISVLLAPTGSASQGSLSFHLRSSPQATEDIAKARLPISEITKPAYYRFDFPAQSDSQHKDYFLLVGVEDGGQVQIFTAPAESYLDGALYKNLVAQDGQLGFQLAYDRQAYLLGLISTILGWIPIILFGILLFILPGWGLFSLLWLKWDEVHWISKLGLSAGLSLAIYPVLLLWTNLVGLQLGIFYAIIPPVVGALALIWKNRKFIFTFPASINFRFRLFSGSKSLSSSNLLADIAFIVILGLVIISRFWIIRSLDVPLFGDSYQHTMISQLIIDHGGLFNSWEPYADLVSLTYHFGFHSDIAVYHWASGMTVEQSMLWAGQLINILAVLGLYPLTYMITKSRWGAVVAMLVGGIISSMPNFYVNWGRYTQLAGQAILPAVIWIAWSVFERQQPVVSNRSVLHRLISNRYFSLDLGSLVIGWLALGGLALTHYRVIIFAILFFPIYGLASIFQKRFTGWLGKTFWLGIGGVLLILPWLIHVIGGKIMNMFVTGLTTIPAQFSGSTTVLKTINGLLIYLPKIIWILLLVGVFLCIIGKHRFFIIFTLWWVLIIIATNPSWLGLPGTGVITNFAIQIAMYIPASVGVGFVFSWIVEKIQNWPVLSTSLPKYQATTILAQVSVLMIICVIGVSKLPDRVHDLNLSSYALITRPDLRAMSWIRDNLPSDAKFLVNSFFAYNNAVVAGSDGGWWIPLLAGRKTSQPPLTYGFEVGAGSTINDTANALVNEIQEKGIGNPEITSLLIQNGIRYIYIGQRQGSVNYSGPQVLDPNAIQTMDQFKVAYHQDRVWIFMVTP